MRNRGKYKVKLSRKKLRELILKEIRVLPSLHDAGLKDEKGLPVDASEIDTIEYLHHHDPSASDILAQSYGYEGNYSEDLESAFNEPYEILRSNAYPVADWPYESTRDPFVLVRITGEYEYYDEDRGEIPYFDLEYVDIKGSGMQGQVPANTVKRTSIKQRSFSNYYKRRS